MAKIHFHGLTNHGAATFYHFICVYEQKIKGKASLKIFPKLYPVAAGIIDSYSNNSQIILTQNKKIIPISTKKEEIYLAGNAIYQDFLRHLRNALAHGQLYKKGKYYYYNDFESVNKQKQQTACAKINCNQLNKIVIDILK